MQLGSPTTQILAAPPNLWIPTMGRAILPFYYFEDPGGFAFEAKKFIKMWFHAKFPERSDYNKFNWYIRVYAGPEHPHEAQTPEPLDL